MTQMIRRIHNQGGFTLVELLAAVSIMLVVIASTFALLTPAQSMFAAQPELSDMQQRLRVAVDALTRDLVMAGSGFYSGPVAGSLGAFFAPVMPYRVGAVSADAEGQYFSDRITVVYVPPTLAQTRIADPIASMTPAVTITSERGCPPADPACGFETGMAVLVMDESGAWDTFTVTDVLGPVLQLQHRGASLSRTYDAGSSISEVCSHTYWLKTDVPTDTYQLMRYDGNRSDVPIADNVVRLAFEYFFDGGSGSGIVDAGRLSPADLLRIRRIRVMLRVQAPATFRAAGPLFFRSGIARTSERYLPDQEITFDVAPRNLNVGR